MLFEETVLVNDEHEHVNLRKLTLRSFEAAVEEKNDCNEEIEQQLDLFTIVEVFSPAAADNNETVTSVQHLQQNNTQNDAVAQNNTVISTTPSETFLLFEQMQMQMSILLARNNAQDKKNQDHDKKIQDLDEKNQSQDLKIQDLVNKNQDLDEKNQSQDLKIQDLDEKNQALVNKNQDLDEKNQAHDTTLQMQARMTYVLQTDNDNLKRDSFHFYRENNRLIGDVNNLYNRITTITADGTELKNK